MDISKICPCRYQGRADVGGVEGVTPPTFAEAVGNFWFVGYSWHNDHGLSVILGRIELNLPIHVYLPIQLF